MRLKWRSLQLLCVLLVPLFILVPRHSSTRDAISYAGTLRLVDALLDEALDLSLSIGLAHPNGSRIHLTGAEAPPTFAPHGSPSPSSFVPSDYALSAWACRILQGRTIILVGPHDTLYQLHSFLLSALHLGTESTARASCPGPSSCPFHPICQPPRSGTGSESLLTPADVTSTDNSSAALLRFLHSGNLNPSPTQEEQGHDHPLVDPRTGVRVIDSRWVRQAAAKASVLVLNRSPLPAPAWSYTSTARNLTWLSTLRALERAHPEPLSHHFTGVLSHLDHDEHEHEHEHGHHRRGRHARRPRRPSAGDSDAQQVVRAALHTTLSTFLPALLQTLRTLREHAGHRPVLGKKPVLWYGSWFLPRSCSPDSLSAFASASDDSSPGRDHHPRRQRRRRLLLARLLAEAEAVDDPWNAYYNAQVYMHDRLLAQLLPTYGVRYLSSLSTVVPPVLAEIRRQGDPTPLVPQSSVIAPDWSCIQRVFETPRGAVMGQKFLRDFVDALDSWNWNNV